MDFASALDAFREKHDWELLQELERNGYDLLITLDHHRQPEVFSRIMNELADGSGRLLRMKPSNREPTSVPVLTRTWAAPYERFAPALVDTRARLIQVGLAVNSQRPLRGGHMAYNQGQVAQMVQQQFTLAPDNTLRVRGTPGLHPRR